MSYKKFKWKNNSPNDHVNYSLRGFFSVERVKPWVSFFFFFSTNKSMPMVFDWIVLILQEHALQATHMNQVNVGSVKTHDMEANPRLLQTNQHPSVLNQVFLTYLSKWYLDNPQSMLYPSHLFLPRPWQIYNRLGLTKRQIFNFKSNPRLLHPFKWFSYVKVYLHVGVGNPIYLWLPCLEKKPSPSFTNQFLFVFILLCFLGWTQFMT